MIVVFMAWTLFTAAAGLLLGIVDKQGKFVAFGLACIAMGVTLMAMQRRAIRHPDRSGRFVSTWSRLVPHFYVTVFNLMNFVFILLSNLPVRNESNRMGVVFSALMLAIAVPSLIWLILEAVRQRAQDTTAVTSLF
jgi:hypothetical protein